MKARNILSAVVVGSLMTLLSPLALAAVSTNDMSIQFAINQSPTEPVNPLDPNPEKPVEPATPEDGKETGQAGPLSIDYLSNFRFGKQTMSGIDNVFHATGTKINEKSSEDVFEVPNYVQVTDNRSSGTGWALTIQQDTPLANENGGTIEKTELRLKNTTMVSAKAANVPTAAAVIKVSPGHGAVNVATAGPDTGYGTWLAVFGQTTEEGSQSVEIEIAGEQRIAKGSYSTALIWTLSDTPSN